MLTNARAFLVRDLVFWYALFMAFVCLAVPPVRYAFYTVPFLVLLVVIADGAGRIADEMKPFLAFCAAGLLLSWAATFEGLKDIFFVAAGISIAVLAKTPRVRVWHVFWLNVVSMAICFAFFKD